MESMQVKTNAIYCGDCLDVLRHFPEGFVDLIYLDPPFSSGRIYNIIFGSNYERKAFDDRWRGGIYHYIEYMKERMELCKRILSDTGSIYLHCDWHASHYLKAMMDEIFGYNNFKNEIVWCYETSGKSKRFFSRKHDVVLFYTKSEDYIFNVDAVKIPRKRNKHMRLGIDKDGRQYEEKTDKKTGKVYRWYFDEGRLPFDYWTDIQFINRNAKERLGYPTQKPIELLERIVKASSKIENIVLDPFCGCGTTIAAAHKLNRKWIGIDISPVACNVMKQRMGNIKTMGIYAIKNIPVIGLPKTENDLRKLKPFDFENWVCDVLFATQTKKAKDGGVDGFTIDGTAIQAKQMDKVGRPLVDNFETAMKRFKRNKGIIVAFGFTKDSHEEVARVKNEGLEIILRTVKELLEMGF